VSPGRAGAVAVLALVALDVAAVPAVLPSARIDLGSSTSGLIWVQEAYLLALAVPLLVLGRVADLRLPAGAGLAAFAAGALLASAADETAALVAGRALQGAGSAALIVSAAATLRPTRHLLPVVGAALLVLAVAPLVGGAVAEKADWRWLFRLELVPAVLAALLLLERPPPLPPASLRRPAVLAAGLVLAAIGLIQSGPWGWASADTLLLLAAGGVLMALAWGDRPSAAAPVIVASLSTMLLFAPQYFELVRGLSPLRSGLLAVAVTGPAVTLAVLAVLASRVARPGRTRPPLTAGLGCAALGALGATRIDPASSYAVVVGALALLGAGAGTAAAALASTRPADLMAWTAAGAALVVAAAGAVFERAQLEERDGGGSFEDALSAGLVGTAWLLAALLAVAAVLAWRRRL
jgi:MFS transporter, DHA2 family, methylenomycin A resistance protein